MTGRRYGPKSYPEKLAEVLFETHEVPGIYLGVPAVFCLFAQGKTTGVVLDSGECLTSAIPIYDGTPFPMASQCLNFGGRDISQYIERHFEATGIDINSLADLNILDTIKQECCVCGIPDDDLVSEILCTPLSLSLSLCVCVCFASSLLTPLTHDDNDMMT